MLNLWEHPEIANVPIRLRIISAIASRRYEGMKLITKYWDIRYIGTDIGTSIGTCVIDVISEGYWQFELTRALDVDPRTMFQHLKALYKYDTIVRYKYYHDVHNI